MRRGAAGYCVTWEAAGVGAASFGPARRGTRRGVAAFVSLGALMVGLGGCATLTRGLDDEVAVLSVPEGASVTSSLGSGCAATPCTLTVARDARFSVTVAKPGFASQTVSVTTRISGEGAAMATENIATAGLGIAVDAATGAALEHVPNPVSVTLVALAPAVAGPLRRSRPHAG